MTVKQLLGALEPLTHDGRMRRHGRVGADGAQ